MNFNEIFVIHPDGSIEPRQSIMVGGVSLDPVYALAECVISGIDFSFVGRNSSRR
jgi:hypothetical protein